MARKKKKPTSQKKKSKKKKRSGEKPRERSSKAAEPPTPESAADSATGADTAVEEPAVDSPTEAEVDADPAAQEPSAHEPAASTETAWTPQEQADRSELPVVDLDEEDVPVIDLDVDEEDDAVERLIAEAIAGAAPEDAVEPPQPVVDLDAKEVAPAPEPGGEGLDAETAAPGGEAPPRPDSHEAVGPGAETLPRQEIADEVARRLVDLGPTSTPELRDRLLAEALAHAEHKDARYRTPFSTSAAGQWKALAASVILLVAGAVALVPPRWARPEPPLRLASAERASSLRAALLLQAQQVEAFRVRTQRLPTTLDEVTETLPGVRYVRSGSRAYQLIVYDPSGSAVVYDSTNPAPAFADLSIEWGGPP